MEVVMEWRPETYGPKWAEVYDLMDWPDPGPAVEFLAERCGKGPVLELAVGTGRIALPLAERGIDVEGLDASAEIVEVMRTKPGGERIAVHFGSIADFSLDGRTYSLIALVLNSLFALQTQQEQVGCFERVATHLQPGAIFVYEGFVPDPTRFLHGGRAHVYEVGLNVVRIEADTFDRATQHVRENHIEVREEGIRLYPAFLRYVWPSEADLMARLAGLELVERFGDWDGTAYTRHSENYIAVYRKSS
jgi:SAM-dependent methyltransferase